MSISTDDLKELPHIVILQSDTEIKVLTFTGENAMEQAHVCASKMALHNYPGSITVAARVRQLCSFKNKHLMS